MCKENDFFTSCIAICIAMQEKYKVEISGSGGALQYNALVSDTAVHRKMRSMKLRCNDSNLATSF